MPGPQSILVFTLLIAAFAALSWLPYRVPHVLVRIASAVAAFAVATVFGIAAVNRYYDYYTGWGELFTDLSGGTGRHLSSLGQVNGDLAQRRSAPGGRLVKTVLTGERSGITRTVDLYFPPQYFDPAYATHRFPAVELLHGAPGLPTDWFERMHAPQVLRQEIVTGRARPAVLVMPDANGGRAYSEQCLDEAGAPRDETFLAVDVPTQLAGMARLQPPGPGWGVAGFSEGGFCAANLALRHPRAYAAAAVMSGYFAPLRFDKIPGGRRDPFGHDRRLRDQNDPLLRVRTLGARAHVPRFWLAAGTGAGGDVALAAEFAAALRDHHAFAPLDLVKGSGHNYRTWRAALPAMLSWITEHVASLDAGAGGPDVRPAPAPSERGVRPTLGPSGTPTKRHTGRRPAPRPSGTPVQVSAGA
ncbi:alpha/beta hydrolase [Actinomadura fibrosa]|uniref:Alpha/beta hydrolase n=1 Tax=Actinomadura fibrosa TaxID=111802 RepID=A0ABW2XT01_9ACTN|nr:alpha/beta hydrolase-fold protein [Actinomadura fibrosa]